MLYPLDAASKFLEELSDIASAGGGNVFVGPIREDPRGQEYRYADVDINRRDWKRLHATFVSKGWTSFGEDSVVHSLPGGAFIIAKPSF